MNCIVNGCKHEVESYGQVCRWCNLEDMNKSAVKVLLEGKRKADARDLADTQKILSDDWEDNYGEESYA